jgi:hypothetical protein
MEQFIDARAACIAIEKHSFAFGCHQCGVHAARMSVGNMQDAGHDSTEVDSGWTSLPMHLHLVTWVILGVLRTHKRLTWMRSGLRDVDRIGKPVGEQRMNRL